MILECRMTRRAAKMMDSPKRVMGAGAASLTYETWRAARSSDSASRRAVAAATLACCSLRVYRRYRFSSSSFSKRCRWQSREKATLRCGVMAFTLWSILPGAYHTSSTLTPLSHRSYAISHNNAREAPLTPRHLISHFAYA